MSTSQPPHSYSPPETSTIPVEILECILQNVPRQALPSIARANTSFNELSEKVIYQQLELTTFSQASQCFDTLRRKPTTAECVRELVVKIQNGREMVSKFGPLLANTLKCLRRLKSLHLAIEGPYLPVLNGCHFPELTTFSSIADLASGPKPLVDFLVQHPTITSLCLGGDSTFPDEQIGVPSRQVLELSLPPSALPRLTTYMGTRRLAPSIVKGRPVKKVTLAWHSPNVETEVPCIISPLRSSLIECFSVATPGWSSTLIRALAACMPTLTSLRLQNVSGDYHNEVDLFRTMTQALRSFPHLARLELPCHRNIRTIMLPDTEMNAARQWAVLAPKLQFIVFPSGRSWSLVDSGRWECLQVPVSGR